MTRDQLEAKIWHALRDLKVDRNRYAANIVENILDYADDYARTTGGLIHEQRADQQLARLAQMDAEQLCGDTPAQRAARRRKALDANRLRRKAS